MIFQLLYKTPTREVQSLDDSHLVRVIGDVGSECHQRPYAMQIVRTAMKRIPGLPKQVQTQDSMPWA
jgi:hypothetical protein